MLAAGELVRIQAMIAFIDQHATESVSRSARRAFSAGTSRRQEPAKEQCKLIPSLALSGDFGV
jgi:hypothetical protein